MTVIEWLQTGVSVVIDGALIMAIVPVTSAVLLLNSYNARAQQVNKQIEKYIEFNQYDYTHVKPQDITAVILSYRGFPAVKVQKADGTWLEWSDSRMSTEYKATKINAELNQNTQYDSDITTNPNGEVIEIIFKPCGGSCGR